MTRIGIVETSSTGAGQELLEAAARKNISLTLFSKNIEGYPKNCVEGYDRVVQCDTGDWLALLAAASHQNALTPFTGVTTVADLFVPQAMFVANHFSLPGMSLEAACRGRNKFLMRQRLAEFAPQVTGNFCIAFNADQAIDFLQSENNPIIAKPQNANDSSGVRLLSNAADIKSYFVEVAREFTNGHQWCRDGILMESFFDGIEFSVEAAQNPGGERHIMGISDRTFFGLDQGRYMEIGVSFPYKGDECALIEEAVNTALDAMEMDSGVTHTECRVTKEGVKIVEMNPRLAGDMVGSHAIKAATGCSALDAVLDTAIGKFAGWQPSIDKGGAMYGVIASKKGIYKGIDNLDEISLMLGVEALRVAAKQGDKVRPALENGDVIAQIVANGDTHLDAHRNAKNAAEACNLIIE